MKRLVFSIILWILNLPLTIILSAQCYEGNAVDDYTVCSGTATLNADAPQGRPASWSASGGAAIATPSAYTTTVFDLAWGENIFIWTVEQSETCGGNFIDTLIITNHEVTADAGQDDYTCINNSYQLQAENPSPNTGKWSVVDGNGIFDNSLLYNTKVTDLAENQNTLIWTVENEDCGIAEDEIVIFNYSFENTVSAGEDFIVCSDSAYLAANDPMGDNGEWRTDYDNTAVIENDELYNTKITNLSHGKNVFYWLVEAGLSVEECSITDSVYVYNYSVESSIISEPVDTCADNAIVTAKIPDYGSGKWIAEDNSITIKEPNTETTIVSDLPRKTSTLQWIVSSLDEEATCKDTATIDVSNNLFTAKINDEDIVNTKCEKENGSATATADRDIPPFTYEWSNGKITQTATELAADTEYEVTVTNGEGCTSSASVILQNEGYPPEEPDISGRTTVYETAKSVEYYSTTISPSYIWNITGGTIASDNGDNILVNWNSSATEGNIELTTTNDYDCGDASGSLDISIIALASKANQNLFTPNGDGIDDVFIIKELQDNPEDFSNNELTVFNSFGAKIYYASPYTNDWTGESDNNMILNGETLPNGSYYYIFKYDKDQKAYKTGYFVVMR